MVLERKAWSPEYRIRTELIVFGRGFTEPVGIQADLQPGGEGQVEPGPRSIPHR
jgi:hypothetical protein